MATSNSSRKPAAMCRESRVRAMTVASLPTAVVSTPPIRFSAVASSTADSSAVPSVSSSAVSAARPGASGGSAAEPAGSSRWSATSGARRCSAAHTAVPPPRSARSNAGRLNARSAPGSGRRVRSTAGIYAGWTCKEPGSAAAVPPAGTTLRAMRLSCRRQRPAARLTVPTSAAA